MGVVADPGAGVWAIATQQEKRRTEKQAGKRVMCGMYSHLI
jgi:hypothetical protein